MASTTAEGPMILPVDYTVVDGTITFRTAAESVPAHVVHTSWASRLPSRRLANQAHGKPWAGGRRDVWVWVDVVGISGRAIT
ncbi:hypothetical protein [Streptomyces sp. NPDC087859]|uniref:hypothetical protein n=1 Tax=Streptomyces sp. NPDC087859 TaxID=3365812 RepID=UPI003816C48E